jgi:hypothetical protein
MSTKRPSRVFVCYSLISTLAFAACSDSPSEPEAQRAAASLEIGAGDRQTASAGESVALAPNVLVKDRNGATLAGVTVRFAIVAGGGTVERSSAETNAQGIASPGRWTLGALPGANTLEASVESLPAVRFTANATSPYHITVRYIGTASSAQRRAVDDAVSRWRSVIIRDLDDVALSVPAGSCFSTQPAISETVDDLIVFIEFKSIDGAGKILGQAGPCYLREADNLPILGYLQLDVADLAVVEGAGALEDLVLHELGHVLGFGTLWSAFALLTGVGTADPQFIGANATASYRQLGGTAAFVPVESNGSPGTRDGHWRESIFGTELMTGFINAPPNPLSITTVGSLQDLGYTANVAAASIYSLGAALRSAPAIMEISTSEVLLRPRYKADPLGRVREITGT